VQRPEASFVAAALIALIDLTFGSDANSGARRDGLLAAGAAAAVVAAARRPEADIADVALELLATLADGSDVNRGARCDAILAAGGGDPVASGLANPVVQAQAVCALAALSSRCSAARCARLLAAGCVPGLVALLAADGRLAKLAARSLAQLAAGGGAPASHQLIATPACLIRLEALMGSAAPSAASFFAAAALAELARIGDEALRGRIALGLPRAAAALALAVGGEAPALPALRRVDRAADRLLCALGVERVLGAAAADDTLRAALQLALPGTAFARLAVRHPAAWSSGSVPCARLAAAEDGAGARRLLLALRHSPTVGAAAYTCLAARPWLLLPPLPPGEPAAAVQRFEDFAAL